MATSRLIRIVEFAHLDGALVEIVEQAGVDAHLAEILPKRLPVRAAAAGRAVVDCRM
jgi:hypothetical protein